MADRLLLRGGSVISMDPKVGDLPKGDVLIEGDKIAQVAPNIQADAQVIDVTGDVVLSDRPGANVWGDFFEMMRLVDVPAEFMADRPMNLPPSDRGLFAEE